LGSSLPPSFFLPPNSNCELEATQRRTKREGCTLERGAARVLCGGGCKGLRRKEMGEGRGGVQGKGEGKGAAAITRGEKGGGQLGLGGG
jgi:hypothetical protein